MLAALCADIGGIDVVVGYPRRREDHLYNAAGVIHDGAIVGKYHKALLPNY